MSLIVCNRVQVLTIYFLDGITPSANVLDAFAASRTCKFMCCIQVNAFEIIDTAHSDKAHNGVSHLVDLVGDLFTDLKN